MGKNSTLEEIIQEEEHVKRTTKKKNKIWINVLILCISVGIWSTVVYYGYTYSKNYIDRSIKNVQQENALNIQALSGKIELLSNEIRNLKNSIDNTDDTIAGSTIVQEKIDEKLKALDNQLGTLEKSLKILKEAPNGQN
ncbi:hypothetical protein IZY60_04030 [Lutibacter sp. B2]|nr:hypothetical protein [Lutibacter sp. B2]